nr:radical SAM protein [Catellatospora chokoriensis]
MPTFRCTAACTYCGTFSNPSFRHASLEPDVVRRMIDQAAEARYRGVVFTGGEATLALDVVLDGIAQASSLGLGTRLVTNGWWAEDDTAAHEVLERLAAAGLDELNLSTGDEHVGFVPLSSVVRAAATALGLGFRVICVMIEVTRDASIRASDVSDNPILAAAAAAHPAANVQILESPWMPTRPDRQLAYPQEYLLNQDNLATKSGCDSCLRTTTVQADGRIAACCGLGIRTVPELQVGHVDSTTLREADQTAGDDLLKRWIRVEGPEKILAWAAAIDPEIEWENRYAHKCQSCLRLYQDERVRTVINEHHQEKIADIVLGEFLLEHFEPEAESGFPSELPTS